MADLFNVAMKWESVTDAERAPLRELIHRLVGYECKIACCENDGVVDIYVQSEVSGCIEDWLELQPSGAIGAIFTMYEDDSVHVEDTDWRCGEYNSKIGVVFDEGVSDSDSYSEVSEGVGGF
jgi:hypothetical protein